MIDSSAVGRNYVLSSDYVLSLVQPEVVIGVWSSGRLSSPVKSARLRCKSTCLRLAEIVRARYRRGTFFDAVMCDVLSISIEESPLM